MRVLVMKTKTAQLFTIAFFLVVHLVQGQTDSLSLSSGTAGSNGGVALSLSLSSPVGNEPTGIEWTVTYPTASVTSIAIAAGPAATSAGKTLSCVPGAGTYTCLLVGENSTIMSNGTAAIVNLIMSAGVTTTPIDIINSTGSSASGNGLVVIPSGGFVAGGASLTKPGTLSCAPNSLGPNGTSTCTITLNQAAPTGGVTVALTSTASGLTVPASVTVAAGSASGAFAATTGALSTSQSATLTATLNSASATTSVSLVAPTTPTTLNCAPNSVGPNATSTCTITLNQSGSHGRRNSGVDEHRQRLNGTGIGSSSSRIDNWHLRSHDGHAEHKPERNAHSNAE